MMMKKKKKKQQQLYLYSRVVSLQGDEVSEWVTKPGRIMFLICTWHVVVVVIIIWRYLKKYNFLPRHVSNPVQLSTVPARHVDINSSSPPQNVSLNGDPKLLWGILDLSTARASVNKLNLLFSSAAERPSVPRWRDLGQFLLSLCVTA